MFTVWAILWILFEVAVLIGFVLLGIACFKLDEDQMKSQAGKRHHSALNISSHARFGSGIPTDVVVNAYTRVT